MKKEKKISSTLSERLKDAQKLSEWERARDIQAAIEKQKAEEEEQRKKEEDIRRKKTEEERQKKRQEELVVLNDQLRTLGTEIKQYEQVLDASEYPRLNRQDYYRIIDHFNYLVKLSDQEKITQDDIDKLRKDWSSGEEKTFDGVPKAFMRKEQYWKDKRKEHREHQSREIGTLFYHGISFVCLIIGIIVGLLAQSWLAFFVILITVIIVNMECERLEYYDHKLESDGRYIFFLFYLIASGLFSGGLFFYLLSIHKELGAWALLIVQGILLVILLHLVSNMKRDI